LPLSRWEGAEILAEIASRSAGESVDVDGEPLAVAGGSIFGLEITLARERAKP